MRLLKTLAPALLLSVAMAHTITLSAQTQADRQTMEQALRSYFQNYGNGLSGFPVTASLNRVDVDNSSRSITITASDRFGEQEFTPSVVRGIYDRIRSIIPNSYRNYSVSVVTHGHRIDDLVPNRLRDHRDIDRSRQWEHISYKGKPWVTRASRPNDIDHGLDGHHLTIAASHGRYYDQKQGWRWQRPNLFCTTEDLFTQTVVVPYLIPMLEKAGAVVWSPRERDWQRHEAIIDNDDANRSLYYAETNGANAWADAPVRGYARHSGNYSGGENPFTAGTARVATATNGRQVSQAIYRPHLPEAGRYAVYVSYVTLPQSVDDVQYTVWHKGRSTVFHVNQRMGGGTWVYLGTFDFDAGQSTRDMVVVSNSSREHGVVTTDAVRFGGGMGNIVRGGRVSGVPRCLEGSRYFAQWAGAPDSVYNKFHDSNDYNDDLNARSLFNNWVAGGSPYVPDRRGLGVPIELMLSVHSDAGYDKNGGNDIVGTLSISTTEYYNGKLAAGISRMASYDLADALISNVGADISAKYGYWRRRAHWDRNYNETREPAVPSSILEILSHQNFGDMRFGLDPNFRFTLARSIYKTLLRYVNEMHGDRCVVQPLAPRHFRVDLTSRHKAKLSWNPVKDPQEPTADPTAYIVYTAIGDLDFDNGVVVKGTSCSVNIEPGTLYHFRVTAINSGGESFPTEVLSAAYISGAQKTVMVVNGFHRLSSPAVIDTGGNKGFDLDADPGVTYGRMAGWSGRQKVFDNRYRGREGEGALGYCGEELVGKFIAGNDFDYVREHANAIHSARKYNIVSCSSEALESGKVKASSADCLDLVLGLERDDGHSLLLYKTFSPAMQQCLTNYTRNHGRLLISGSYIGSDMTTATEQNFLASVLKLRCDGSERGATNGNVQGLGMTFDTWRTLNEYHYAATAPDILSPLATSFCVMRYADGRNAAVAYSGRDYRCFTMGFPIECIKDERTRASIMKGILNYLLN